MTFVVRCKMCDKPQSWGGQFIVYDTYDVIHLSCLMNDLQWRFIESPDMLESTWLKQIVDPVKWQELQDDFQRSSRLTTPNEDIEVGSSVVYHEDLYLYNFKDMKVEQPTSVWKVKMLHKEDSHGRYYATIAKGNEEKRVAQWMLLPIDNQDES